MPKDAPGIELSVSVDGQPWTAGVLLGAGGSAGTGEATLRLSDAQLTVAPEGLPDPVPQGSSIFVGRTLERSSGSGGEKALPAETADRLRALGYIE